MLHEYPWLCAAVSSLLFCGLLLLLAATIDQPDRRVMAMWVIGIAVIVCNAGIAWRQHRFRQSCEDDLREIRKNSTERDDLRPR